MTTSPIPLYYQSNLEASQVSSIIQYMSRVFIRFTITLCLLIINNYVLFVLCIEGSIMVYVSYLNIIFFIAKLGGEKWYCFNLVHVY